MKTLDYDFARHLMEALLPLQPLWTLARKLESHETEREKLAFHADYLHGHGLIEIEWRSDLRRNSTLPPALLRAKLTSKGIDFTQARGWFW